MTASLRAVAKLAGVHPATASRALNDRKSHLVSEATRGRVQQAAITLDYQPNPNAAALRSGRSRLVGILVPGLGNPVYAPIMAGAAEVLNRAGIGTLVSDTAILRERSGELVRALAARRVDGLLMATAVEDRNLGVAEAMAQQMPLVLLNRSLPGTVAVRPDHMASMAMVVDHLVGLGHRQIGYLGGNVSSSWRGERMEAFHTAMARHRLAPVLPAREVEAYGRHAGKDGALRMLRDAPHMTALVCGNDLIAVGAYDAARTMGVRVPADLSVTGHNDIQFMDVLAPPLTTIRIDWHGLGATGAGLLLRRIAGEPVEDMLVEAELMLRASTAPPR